MIARLLLAALALAGAPAARAETVLGEDAAACAGAGPAIRVEVVGLKDRTGRLKLELYPANEADFLKDDHDLIREGKTFRRVWADPPKTGGVAMCIRTPAPGRYALLFTHDRDFRNKFDFWKDGAGFVSDQKLGRQRPKVGQAIVDVKGVTPITVRVQYLKGLGFAPLTD